MDGLAPSWRLAYNASVDTKVNTEVGGIRGLTTLPAAAASPPRAVAAAAAGGGSGGAGAAAGDSLIFVWTPNGRSAGEIRRLDGPDLAEATEGTLRGLYNQHAAAVDHRRAAGGGRNLSIGSARSNLGGYNQFFEVRRPGSDGRAAPPMHIIGFETSVQGCSPELAWHGFYAGGCYAVRATAAARPGGGEAGGGTTWTTGVVNGVFEPGSSPVLEAARAFELSPFPGEERVIYVGGFG